MLFRSPNADASDIIYTCPMHPQIRRNAPGNCPICGMALEPEIATVDPGSSAEYLDMIRIQIEDEIPLPAEKSEPNRQLQKSLKNSR